VRATAGDSVYGLYCDVCNESLLVESNVRYVVKIEVYAAYDPLEITEEDLSRATKENWDKLMEEIAGADPEELSSHVHVSRTYDLCPTCRNRYLRDPLRSARPAEGPREGPAPETEA
jgi:hypothetical protein